MSFGSTIKKVVSGGSKFIGAPLQMAGRLFGSALNGIDIPGYDPNSGQPLNQLADEEAKKRQELGLKQQGQINTFASDQGKRAADYRAKLADSLAQTSANTFKSMNPYILEDLNSRGLFTSQTARDQEQGRLLSDLANQQNQQLTAFDTGNYNDQEDLRGQGLNALLSGDQSALDAALSLKKAGLQRQFDSQDSFNDRSFAASLAKQKSKSDLIGSLIGAGGSLFGGHLGRG